MTYEVSVSDAEGLIGDFPDILANDSDENDVDKEDKCSEEGGKSTDNKSNTGNGSRTGVCGFG